MEDMINSLTRQRDQAFEKSRKANNLDQLNERTIQDMEERIEFLQRKEEKHNKEFFDMEKKYA